MTKRCTIRDLKLLLESNEAVEEAGMWDALGHKAEQRAADMRSMR